MLLIALLVIIFNTLHYRSTNYAQFIIKKMRIDCSINHQNSTKQKMSTMHTMLVSLRTRPEASRTQRVGPRLVARAREHAHGVCAFAQSHGSEQDTARRPVSCM